MNLIEGFSQDNWELSLWSDAIHRVDTSTIKNLVGLVAGHLDLQLSVKARYFNEHRHWVISFLWIVGGERINGAIAPLIQLNCLELTLK